MVAAWVVGVLLAVGAAAAAAVGDNLVKRAYLDQALAAKERRRKRRARRASDGGGGGGEDHEAEKPLWQRPLWVAGIFCMVVLNAGMTVASFAFVDASMTIPFGGLHICFNIPLAWYINGERFSLRAIMFNGLIFAGVMVVLLFGNHVSRTFTAQELLEIAAAPGFIVAAAVMVISTTLIWFYLARSGIQARERVGWTLFAGMVGSITQTFAKAMSECIKDGAWAMPITYVCIGLTIGSALAQVVFLNKCLDRYPAFFVVPLVNSTIIIVGSIFAAIYFQEVNRWSLKSRVCVPIGILVTGLGILLLSFAEPEEELDQSNLMSDEDDDEDDDDGDNARARRVDLERNGDNETSSLMRPLTAGASRNGYASTG